MSVYRFEQKDIFRESLYRNYAYLCLDTPLLCRLPLVAGAQAPSEMKATADFLPRSLADFVYGIQPWEPFKDTGKAILIDGDQNHLVEPEECRWKHFMTTKESAERFAKAGYALVSYIANFYMK